MGAVAVQCFVTFILAVLHFMAGIAIVWPSYGLRMLQAADSPLEYTIKENDANLIGSMFMLGSLIAGLFVGYISDQIGRKGTGILSGLSFVIAWTIMATAKSVIQIIIGRLIVGFASGIHMIMGSVFVAEISQNSLRGTLMTVLTFAFNIGNLISYIEGWFCSYQIINYANLSLGIVVLLLLCILKETPAHLMRLGKEKEALNSLKFYRGAKTVTQEILDELYCLRNLQETSNSRNSFGENYDSAHVKLNENDQVTESNLEQNPLKILIASKSSQRIIITLTLLSVLTVFMGMIGVITYAGQLFQRAAPDISPDMCSVIMAAILTISGAVAVVITDLIPRRVLMMVTCAGATTCMALLASMLHWSWAPDWGITLMIISFSVCFQIGPANIPYVQVAECIPIQLKSLASPIIFGSIIISNFIILYLFEPVVKIFGLDGIFCIFAITSTIMVIATYLFMRETMKEPLENIQSMFEQGYIYCRRKI